MDRPIRAAVAGCGNLGIGAAWAVSEAPDMALTAAFTRREPGAVRGLPPGVPVVDLRELLLWKSEVDVLILCEGSATDLPELTPALAREFTLVDSFDTHQAVPEHFRRTDRAAREGGKLAVISGGWDPGLFSLFRLLGEAFLPEGTTHTFWGPGVSQGHSQAVRSLPGVLDAKQYTLPSPEAVELARRGELPVCPAWEKHHRRCFIAAEEGTDRAAIERAVKSMPCYFAEYDTTVEFVSQEELAREHSGSPHGGTVIRTGGTGREGSSRETMELRLKLQSNPQFTGSVLTALARAAGRLAQRGEIGCRTVFDIPACDLSPKSREELLGLL